MESRKRQRVLFLRSYSKICSFSMIANGLRSNAALDFCQYPPLPQSAQPKLEKLYDPQQAWEDLNTNLIGTPQELAEKLTNKAFDLVILADHQAQLIPSARLDWRRKLTTWIRLVRQYGKPASARSAVLPSLPVSLAELCQRVPVAVVDLTDPPYLDPTHRDLLKGCAAYFKREIPYNRFVLYHALFPFHYLGQAGKDPELLRLLDKVQGIPLGIQDDKFQRLTAWRTAQQDIDVFWAARISNTMRRVTEAHLRDLAARTSWKIEMPQTPLPFQEYCQTVARSKITISVEGGGWDCDRHYEAVALGSLPLMNTPTNDAIWWHPLPKEVFFDNDFSNFTARLESLRNAETLRCQCWQQVEHQIRTHMLWSKIINYIVGQDYIGYK